MAQVPYGEGVPTVTPDVRTPDDYQHERATPEEAGGLIAQGLERAGQGAEKASSNLFDIAQFHDKINADYANNNTITAWDNIMHGVPGQFAKGTDGQPILGPDGKPVPDRGYMGLTDRDALDQRQATLDKMEQVRQENLKNLKSPYAQNLYDEQSRRLLSLRTQEIGEHAERQYTGWATGVNENGADIHLASIARNPYDADSFNNNAADYINFKVQAAQLKYGNDPTIYKSTVEQAHAEAWSARLQAIAVKDPQAALNMTDKAKDVLSVVNRRSGQSFYDELSAQFRARADQQSGIQAGSVAVAKATLNHPYANPGLPIYRQATDSMPNGYSPGGLARTIQIESGGDPNATNGTHVGLAQFAPATAREVGVTNPNDPEQSINGAQKYAVQNRPILSLALHRAPTDAELYLAHQQGPFGAVKLLQNPTIRAGSLVGDDQIRGNGGDPNAPASAFTAMWTQRFNNPTGEPASLAVGPGASARSIKGDAYAAVMNDPNLSVGARDHALHYVSTTIAAQEIAQDQNEKANKVLVEQTADEYSKAIHTGQGSPELVGRIATDPRLNSDWKTRDALINLARAQSGNDIAGASMQYGPGFWSLYKSATAPPGDPNRLADQTMLYQHAGPGGDLTLAGVEKLKAVMTQNQKSVSDASVNQAKVGLLDYAKQKLSFEEDTGPIKIRDPKGEALFHATFIPKFEAAYDQWVKDGKDPWQFLSRENVDKMLTGMRPKSQMDADRMIATGEAQADVPGQAPQELPPTPENVKPETWANVISHPPTSTGGHVWPYKDWAGAVNKLRENPTPELIKAFDDKFGPAGITAKSVLDQLNPSQEKPAEAAPPVEETLSHMQPQAQPTPEPTLATPLSSREGAGPAGYLGNLIRSITPQRVQDYVGSR